MGTGVTARGHRAELRAKGDSPSTSGEAAVAPKDEVAVIAPTAGTYFLHVYPYQVDGASYATFSSNQNLGMNAVLPPHFTQPYNLTITFGN